MSLGSLQSVARSSSNMRFGSRSVLRDVSSKVGPRSEGAGNEGQTSVHRETLISGPRKRLQGQLIARFPVWRSNLRRSGRPTLRLLFSPARHSHARTMETSVCPRLSLNIWSIGKITIFFCYDIVIIIPQYKN